MNLLRKILFPIVPIYYLATWLRNKLYDYGVKDSKRYNFPVIAVGNLSVGGTGKSPMVEYLIRLLKDNVRLATLSRGYKRETKGFQLVNTTSTAAQVGDEPLQFKTKFPDALVGVDADRQNGIASLRSQIPQPEIVILDDAYQHRKVKAGFYVLLTSYTNLYSKDILLPTGDLREPRAGAKRADVVVVTKCPHEISAVERKKIASGLKVKPHQALFFAGIKYTDHVIGRAGTKSISSFVDKSFVLVTGIANPKPLVEYYQGLGLKFDHLNFPDHHNFSEKEIAGLKEHECIITTEKDYVRLIANFSDYTLWYQPMQMDFIEEGDGFNNIILNYIKNEVP